MSLLITGVIDGPLPQGLPKAIELTALDDIADLSLYGIGTANNGGGSDGQEFTFPEVALAKGETIYVASQAAGFNSFFGFDPDYISTVASFNGDDSIELFKDGAVVDLYGDVNSASTTDPWNYMDGWAYRNDGAAPSPTFDINDWTVSGRNALDGETSNATAATPFPIGTYSARSVVAATDFDGGDVGLITGFDPANDNLDGGPGDFFGVANLGAWPQGAGVPFSIADDSVVAISGGGVRDGDAEGIFGQNADPENDFFAMSDSDAFNAQQTARWTFDIAGFSDLEIAIDMGGISDDAFGGYNLAETDVQFTVQIDNGALQTVFDIDPVQASAAGSFTTRPNDAGDATGGGSVLDVSGDATVTKLLAEDGSEADNTFVDKSDPATGALDTFVTSVAGTGSTLTVTVTADMPFEAFAFDNIEITGAPGGTTPQAISIAPLDADKPEGDTGTTPFTFTVSRTGDTSEAASVDFAVSGEADAADFGGTLPSGTVNFAADEASTTLTLDVSGDETLEPDEAFTVTLSNPVGADLGTATAQGVIRSDELDITLISEIQGNAATWGEQFGRDDATPFFGATVSVSAVVVGDFQNGDADDTRNLGGFYLQEEDADADADDTTSEGIFVFEGGDETLLDVNVGDRVTVTGTATEFFGETQISVSSVVIEESEVALPTAAEITFPVASTLVNADGQLIADLEAYEGMRVEVPQTLTVGDLFSYGQFGEIGLNAGGPIETYTQNNAPSVTGFAAYVDEAVRNTVVIDDGRTERNPDVLPYPDGAFDVGDGLTGGDTVEDLVGVLRFSRGSGGFGDENYRINPTEAPTFVDTTPREEVVPDVGGSLKVASFNVLNYFNGDGLGDGFPTPRGADTPEEFARQTEKLVSAISAIDADVVGLIEIENDGDEENSAIQSLVDELNLAGGTYAAVEAGRVGGDAIAVGFIYDTTTVSLTGDFAVLDNTVDARFDSDNQRASLAQTFTEIDSGESFTAVVNHFKSKGSPVAGTPGDEDIGDGAGNANATRTNAAEALADWIATDPTGSGDADVLIIGDLNAYMMEDPIQALLDGSDDIRDTADDLQLLTEDNTFGFPLDLGTAPQVQAFGALDYALGNESLAGQVTGAAAWNINAVEPAYIDYNEEFKPEDADLFAPDPFRSSDHDPIIVGLDLGGAAEPETALARVAFEERRFFDKAVATVDGVEVGSINVPWLAWDLEIDGLGLTIEARDDRAFTPDYVSALGQGIGVWSVFADRFFGFEKKAVNGAQVLSFALEDDQGLGDALDVTFEFERVRRSDEVELIFYDETEEVDRVLLEIEDNRVSYDLEGETTFDRVEIGAEGRGLFTVGAVEFNRLVEDDGLNVV
ncbi:MAG: ExeM/NucH family extracellular endonuclease [Pseudomonadota bacterium]